MGVLTRDRSVRFPRAGSQATNIMGCSWHRNKTVSKQGMAGNGKIAEEGCFTTNLFQTCMCTYIYPRGLGFSDGEAVGWGGVGWGMLPSCSCYVDATLMGGVGWGGACYRHVHVTLMLR